jgi:hypothetical protein
VCKVWSCTFVKILILSCLNILRFNRLDPGTPVQQYNNYDQHNIMMDQFVDSDEMEEENGMLRNVHA